MDCRVINFRFVEQDTLGRKFTIIRRQRHCLCCSNCEQVLVKLINTVSEVSLVGDHVTNFILHFYRRKSKIQVAEENGPRSGAVQVRGLVSHVSLNSPSKHVNSPKFKSAITKIDLIYHFNCNKKLIFSSRKQS